MHVTRSIAQELADSFLLTTSEDPFSEEPIIEVSHEALIKNWPRLQHLVNDHRLFLCWFVQDFSPYFQGWLAEKDLRSKKTLMLPDVILREALQWQERHPQLLVGPRADYIHKSVTRHRRKRLYQVLVTAAILLAALVAILTYNSANLSRGAELRERGVQALLQHDYQQAQLLLAESLQYSNSDEARKDLLEARINGAKALPVKSLKGIILYVTGDGSRFAFRSEGGTIKVWERERDEEKETAFVMPEADAKSARVALSQKGILLAYGDPHGHLQLWDLTNGRQAAEQPPPSLDKQNGESGIDSIAISPDERLIAYGNMGGVITIWDRTAGAARRFPAHDGAVHCLSFSPTGSKLASGGADSQVEVFDLTAKDGKPVSLGYHDDFVTSVVFNGSESQLASGSADASIRVWDIKSGSEAYMLTGHLGSVTSVSFNPEGNLILSGSEDKTVRLWDATVRREILKLKTYGEGAVDGAAFTPNEFRIVSGGRNGDVRLWEISTRPEGMTIYHTHAVGAVAFYPDSRRLVFGDNDGNVYSWDTQSKKEEILTKFGAGVGVDSLAFSDNGLLAAGAYNGSIQVWDTNGSPKLKQSFNISGPVWGLAFQPSGRWIAAGGGTVGKPPTDIHIWDVETGQEVKTLEHDHVSVWNLAFSSDGQTLASGGGDKKIRLWNMGTLQRAATFEPKEGDELWAVLFGEGDKTLATAGLDRKVKIWSVSDLLSKPDAIPLQEFYEHEGIIQSAAISRSGKLIATASADHTVGLWDVKTGRKLRLDLHVRPIWWVTFSRDEKLLASGSIDRRVRISNLDSINHVLAAPYEELLREAKSDTCLDMESKGEIKFTLCQPD
jgi:WD40 repeat protein